MSRRDLSPFSRGDSGRDRSIAAGIIAMAVVMAIGGSGCGPAEQPSASAAAPPPSAAGKKDEFTRKERAKMNEMDREEMLEYKKKLREERAEGGQGARP